MTHENKHGQGQEQTRRILGQVHRNNCHQSGLLLPSAAVEGWSKQALVQRKKGSERLQLQPADFACAEDLWEFQENIRGQKGSQTSSSKKKKRAMNMLRRLNTPWTLTLTAPWAANFPGCLNHLKATSAAA